MWRPFLLPGESVLLQVQDVSVKSTRYTLILTSSRLLLCDPSDQSDSSPLQIVRAAILRVEAAADARGMPAIRLSTGTPRGVRSLLLVFPPSPGGATAAMRDAWLSALRGRAACTFYRAREPAEKRVRPGAPSPSGFSGRMLLVVGIICVAVLISIAAAFVSGVPDTDSVSSPPHTPPAPESPAPTVQKGSSPDADPTVTAVTPPEGAQPPVTPVGPLSFSVAIDPVTTQVRPGDTVRYRMKITADEGFSEPVHLQLQVRALLFFEETYDLGTYAPPFPRSGEYAVAVPQNIPPGVKISGMLTAASSSQLQKQTITVQIR